MLLNWLFYDDGFRLKMFDFREILLLIKCYYLFYWMFIIFLLSFVGWSEIFFFIFIFIVGKCYMVNWMSFKDWFYDSGIYRYGVLGSLMKYVFNK